VALAMVVVMVGVVEEVLQLLVLVLQPTRAAPVVMDEHHLSLEQKQRMLPVVAGVDGILLVLEDHLDLVDLVQRMVSHQFREVLDLVVEEE
jgi:glucose/arabinose dehydrogenase